MRRHLTDSWCTTYIHRVHTVEIRSFLWPEKDEAGGRKKRGLSLRFNTSRAVFFESPDWQNFLERLGLPNSCQGVVVITL